MHTLRILLIEEPGQGDSSTERQFARCLRPGDQLSIRVGIEGVLTELRHFRHDIAVIVHHDYAAATLIALAEEVRLGLKNPPPLLIVDTTASEQPRPRADLIDVVVWDENGLARCDDFRSSLFDLAFNELRHSHSVSLLRNP